MSLEQFGLFGCPFLGVGLAGVSGLLPKRLGQLGHFLVEGLLDENGLLGRPFGVDCFCVGFDTSGLGLVGVGVERDGSRTGLFPSRHVECRFEDCSQAVVVDLRNRIVAVIVALSTTDGESEDGGGDDVERFGDDLVSVGDVIGTGRPVRRGSQETGRRQQLHVAVRQVLVGWLDQFVAGELFDEEGVPRRIGVVGVDDPIAISPGPFPLRVGIGHSFAVGVSGRIQPVSSPAFSVVRAGQQSFDQSFPGTRSGVGEELFLLCEVGRQSEQVEGGSSQQGLFRSRMGE